MADPSPAVSSGKDGLLRFSFDRTPWKDVIEWLASSSGLALHVSEVPTGSFTYSDSDSFTPQAALDRVNLFLLPEGFTLVRSGKLLSVIDLSDARSTRQLDALARLITIEQLDQSNDHDVVKCIFSLGKLDAEAVIEELSALKLMMPPAVFSKTNQLMVTDTAVKLKSVKAILRAFQPETLGNGTVVKNFALQHVNAEDILVVARPHLGLATGEMIGIDVSLSADLQGEKIFVTGIEDKVKLIEGLITAIDQPRNGSSTTGGDVELRSHTVAGGNVEIVYNVLQTLLADKSIRLSMDRTAGSIVALANRETQSEIAQTVSQLQAAEADFEVIPLKTVDPWFAITLLEEMLDLPDAFDDPKDIDPDAPRIDADPANMRLFVRGRKHQIEQIRKIIAGLEEDSVSSSGNSNEIRIFPLRGKQAEHVLETAATFWRAPNPVFFFPSVEAVIEGGTERVVNGESTRTNPFTSSPPALSSNARLLTNNPHAEEPAIRCQLTPRGLLLQSEDTAALDQFEKHLRTIAGPADSTPSAPIVFYLKYTRPDDAIQMLAKLLDGSDASRDVETGSLVNGYVTGSSNTFLGSLVSSREGTTTMMAGSITVVADSRLNRLIVQGTVSDIELIEDYLKIIDKDNSITSIETYGTSHVIELTFARASEVATAIREAYAGRVIGGTDAAGPAGAQPQNPGATQQQTQRETVANKSFDTDKQSGDKKSIKKESAGQVARDLEPKMTIAVHESSNSLIVTAPEQLFKEVELLAGLIDARSQKAVRIIRVPGSVEIRSLKEIFSGGTKTSASTKKTPTR